MKILIILCLITGLFLGFVTPKEYKQPKTIEISYERSCAIEAVYAEARGTSLEEREMILQVILNRTKHKDYPSTICGVINQPFQFSFRNNLKSNASIIPKFESMNSLDQKAFLEIEELVDSKLVSGKIKPNTVLKSNVLFFHTKSVSPSWSKDKKFKKVLDNGYKHKYYSFVN